MQDKNIKFLIIALAVAVIVPQITFASWWNPFSWEWGWLNKIFHFQQTEQKQEKLIGGDKDSHGCLIGAGYSWCEAKNKCLRTWEEKCEKAVDPTAGWKTYTNAEYGFEFKYPSDIKITESTNSVIGTYQNPVGGFCVGDMLFVVGYNKELKNRMEDYFNGYYSSSTDQGGEILNTNANIKFINLIGGEPKPCFYALIKGEKLDIFIDGYSGGFDNSCRLSEQLTENDKDILSTFKFTK